jgi:hypothetical protein
VSADIQIRQLQQPTSARLSSAAGQSIPNSANTALTFSAAEFDLMGMFTASDRLTVPVKGAYLVGATVEFASSATGRRGLYLQKNGTTLFAGHLQPATSYGAVTVTSLLRLDIGDYVRALAFQDSGGALALNTNGWSSQLWIARQGNAG